MARWGFAATWWWAYTRFISPRDSAAPPATNIRSPSRRWPSPWFASAAAGSRSIAPSLGNSCPDAVASSGRLGGKHDVQQIVHPDDSAGAAILHQHSRLAPPLA